MGLNRYFVPNLPKTGSIDLPPDEAHHALRVRREAVGGRCVAFDGQGHVASCHIVQATKREMTIEVDGYWFEPNELAGWIQLAVAMPKGDRQRAVIEKAVELGVHEVVPLVCQRSVSIPNDSGVEKWNRVVIEACKQCERNRLLTIAEPCTLSALMQRELSTERTMIGATLRMFAHPRDNASDVNLPFASLYDRCDTSYRRATIAIGPEGGFTDTEVRSAIEAGWTQLDLGPRILRVETAVCAASIYASLRVKANADESFP